MARKLHVVMLPWSAFGHLMPFFQLSIALAKSGVKVSFISTPKNIQRLPKPAPESEVAALINFVEFPLPAPAALDNKLLLPEGAEATVDVPSENIQYLKIAYDLLQHPFKQFVAQQSVDWIIVDVISHWAGKIAQEYQVPLLLFSAYSAAAFQFIANPECLVGDGQKRLRPSAESLTSVPEWVDFPSSVALRTFDAIGMHAGFYGMNASGITDAHRIAEILHSCQAMAIRDCPEFEGEYLNLLEKLIGKPVIPVGLLPPEPGSAKGRDHQFSNNTTTTSESYGSASGREIFQWLDEQKPRSVVFVGFGSECKLSKDQVYEIAYGLELSGLPFLWALRKPEWATDDVDALPLGFADTIRGKGIVSIGWAPQLEILGHPSIGTSLFHGGWGSVIETLLFGHSLVVLPLILDQPLNARLLVDKDLAVQVERKDDGSFTRDGIAKALRLATGSEEGEKLRVRAREAACTFNDKKLHDDYSVRFVEYLKINGVTK